MEIKIEFILTEEEGSALKEVLGKMSGNDYTKLNIKQETQQICNEIHSHLFEIFEKN